jgi:DNA-binding NtrC family response regulator
MTELAKRATQARRMTLDNRALRRELADGSTIMKKLIGTSPAMERLREDILDLGQADSHVLIDGETGTGKTLVAHALHAVGPRASKKFVAISCAAWSEDSWRRGSLARARTGRCRWSRRRGAGRCAWRISRRCRTRCRRGF